MSGMKNSYLYHEIHEQPQILDRLLSSELANARALAADIYQRNIGHVVIAARGTSDNAGRYAKYLLGAVNGLLVGLATPSLFTVYGQPPRFGNSLVLGISQSGKSPDIVAVLAEAKRQGALTAAITNIVASDLGSTVDHILDLNAGEEKSVAATKTYTSELAAIALLSVCLNGKSGREKMLAQVPRHVEQALLVEPAVARIAERYRYMEACVVIGRGYNYATAFELALKLKELTYTVVEPYSSADFMHGPLAMVEPGFPVIVIAPSGKMLPELLAFCQMLGERGAELVVISDDASALELARVPLQLPPSVPEWLSPLTSIIPGQLFAMHLAYARDIDPDRPRGLRKVTETR
jgi:glucosamine--fructose-6-phosphate aminotransferase (isomerizing)